LGHRILPQGRRRARKTRLSAFSGIFAISATLLSRNPLQCL